METNPNEYTPAESINKQRNEIQKEIIQDLKKWACRVLGKEDISDDELIMFLIEIGFAVFFANLWNIVMFEDNWWYAGEEFGYPPTAKEAWDHLARHYQALEIKDDKQGQ